VLTISGVHILPAVDTYSLDDTNIRTCQITDQINTGLPVTFLSLCMFVYMSYKASSLCSWRLTPVSRIYFNPTLEQVASYLQNVMNGQCLYCLEVFD
jgi:hypothetical protein